METDVWVRHDQFRTYVTLNTHFAELIHTTGASPNRSGYSGSEGIRKETEDVRLLAIVDVLVWIVVKYWVVWWGLLVQAFVLSWFGLL